MSSDPRSPETEARDESDDAGRLRPTAADRGHMLVRAAISAVPYAGGPLLELFNEIVTPPLMKRRDQWIVDLADGLQKLEAKVDGFSMETLGDNPSFITAVAHASSASMRSHNEEKRSALRNAVLNVAAGRAPTDDLQLMFLNLVDRFTAWHLRILKFMQDPKASEAANRQAAGMMAGAFANVLEAAYPELVCQRAFYDLLVKELRDAGLTNTDSAHGMMTGAGLLEKRTTAFGDEFLKFIESPVKEVA